MEGGSRINSIEETIEKSKSQWSQAGEFDSDSEVSNMEFLKILQGHPTWGTFFRTFGKGGDSLGDLVMGKKFVEGGQAKIYEVQIKWYDLELQGYFLQKSLEFVLKVFKRGIFLRHLQLQWPQGMLQHHINTINWVKLRLCPKLRFHCDVCYGTLLEDGRFAFLMVKEQEDLRSMLNCQMLTRSNNEGPLSKREALKAMYEVALGMNQLSNRGIVHRDIKASNVLLSRTRVCHIANFECSIGIVGIGFFRAPEILEACKHGNVSTKVELFTKAMDIYSYGMTCYEILTGKLPFEGHLWNDYDLVLHGKRPKLPNYVDGWIQKLLNSCWQSNPVARPSSQEILRILLTNSTICRRLDLHYQKREAELGIRKALDRKLKISNEWRLLKLKMKKLKILRLFRR